MSKRILQAAIFLLIIIVICAAIYSFSKKPSTVIKKAELVVDDSSRARAPNHKRRIVHVSINNSWPDSFLDKQGTPQGLLIDILNEIANYENWQLIYIMDEWQTGLEKLKNCEVELKVSIALTKERDMIFDFSAEPAYLDWANVIVNDLNIQNILDLNNRKVAITHQGFFPMEFQNLCTGFGISPQFIRFQTDEDILMALERKQVDAGVIPHVFAVLNAHKYNVKFSPIVFSPIGVFFATPEGKYGELLETIDRYLIMWKKDHDSFYYETLGKWIYSEKTRAIVPHWILVFLGIGVGLVAFLFIWVRILRYQVKRRTYALQESEKRFFTLFENSPASLWEEDFSEVKSYLQSIESEIDNNIEHYLTIHPEVLAQCAKRVKIIDVNQATLKLHGAKTKEELLENLNTTFTSDSYPTFQKEIIAIQHGIHYLETEAVVKTLDGIERYINLQWQVSPQHKETLSRVLISITDITERKLTEDKNKALLIEKELLLKEVHHRIKNNMYTIKGLLAMQIDSENNPSAYASLKDAESRVQSIIMLYDRLHCTDNYRELSVKAYLEPLAEEIIHSFSKNRKITLTTEIDDFILNLQQLTPLGIIINELLTNMMKHAFIGQNRGTIFISVSLRDKNLKIVLRDNGVGIPESISFSNPSGFGMKIVSMLLEQFRGNIQIERDKGTKFILEFIL